MKKRAYKKPVIKSIRIDNQISMVMMSVTPPDGPPGTENSLSQQQTNLIDPYKISRV